MKKQDYVKCTYLGSKYKTTSIYGNPSYYVFLSIDGRYTIAYTASDAVSGYSIRNNREGDTIYIKYHVTKKGSVIIDYLLSEVEYQRSQGGK